MKGMVKMTLKYKPYNYNNYFLKPEVQFNLSLIIVIISDTMEARYLYNYAQSLELLDDDTLNNPESSLDG